MATESDTGWRYADRRTYHDDEWAPLPIIDQVISLAVRDLLPAR